MRRKTRKLNAERIKSMKNGKHPTLAQKKFMKSHGLDPEDHLVVKNTQEFLEVVSKMALKKQQIMGVKARTKKIFYENH